MSQLDGFPDGYEQGIDGDGKGRVEVVPLVLQHQRRDGGSGFLCRGGLPPIVAHHIGTVPRLALGNGPANAWELPVTSATWPANRMLTSSLFQGD